MGARFVSYERDVGVRARSRDHRSNSLAVVFSKGSVRVNCEEHPELDSKAIVELYDVDKSEASLRKKTEKMGARFVSYENGRGRSSKGSVRVNCEEHPELDSKAIVELYDVDKSEASLRKKTEKMGARFVSYENGTWAFEVRGFGGGGTKATKLRDPAFGSVTWERDLGITSEQLARAVVFSKGSVRVNCEEHPELDSKAIVELYDVDKSEASLRKKTEKMGARFVSYENGTWAFEAIVELYDVDKSEASLRKKTEKMGARFVSYENGTWAFEAIVELYDVDKSEASLRKKTEKMGARFVSYENGTWAFEAIVELYDVDKSEASLRKKTEKMGARFVSYENGTWAFELRGFGGGGTKATKTTHYYLGLRSIVTVYDGGDETTDRLEIDYMVGRIPGSRDVDPMREALLESCADSAAGNQIGALLSCVTLIFALLGTINRMKFSSDANVQKALGLVTDTWGALTLSYTLFNFHANCFDDLPSRFQRLDLDYEWGPGWICYLFCALSDIIRAAAHWVTPTPGNGSVVCTLSLPAEIVKLLDADGDGEITWEDQKLMFKNLKKLIAHETVVVRSRAMLLRADIFEGGGCVMRAASDAAEDLADRVRASLAAHDESPHALGELEKRDLVAGALGSGGGGASAGDGDAARGAGDGDAARDAGDVARLPLTRAF
ncbi:endonuclease [Aureococcus anophagefferens]|nr:endonuclease [Aureococcus anophagefferens]